MGALLGLGLLAVYAVTIEAADSCPSAAAVQARLRALSPDGTAAPGRVKLTRVAGALDVEIAIDGAAGSFHRRLPPLRSCAEEARVAATVIAAWQGQSDGPAPPLSVAAAPPAPTVAPSVPRAPVATAVALPARRRAVVAEVDVAFFAALAGAAVAPGAAVEARLARRGGPVGASLGLLGEAPRDVGLGSGRAAWGRSALRVGADYRLWHGRFSFDLGAQGLLALLYVKGSGFAETYRRFDVDVGLAARARIGVQAGPVRPWFAAELIGWLRPEQALAVEGGTTVSADIPRVELLLGVGLAIGGRR